MLNPYPHPSCRDSQHCSIYQLGHKATQPNLHDWTYIHLIRDNFLFFDERGNWERVPWKSQYSMAPMQCPALKKHCSVCLVQIASGNSSTVDLRPGVACKPQSLGNLTHPSGEPGVAAICSIKWNLLLQIGTLSKTALEDERRWKNRTNMNKMNLWSECFKQILIVASHGFKL